MTEREALATAVEQDGWAVTPSVVPEVEVDQLIDQLGSLATTQDNRGGIRNLLDVSPAMCALAAFVCRPLCCRGGDGTSVFRGSRTSL